MLKVGFLGAGHIAEKMALTINEMEGVELYAVSSRDEDKAERFRKKFGAKRAYGSYEEMLGDKEVDLVYVATIISRHAEHMMMCLDAGKHVLCEKSFTVNAREAEAVIGKAREKGLYLAEAIWTRYMPSRRKIQEIIDSGEIGRIRMISANLSYPIYDDNHPRILKPETGGGALLDLGVYPLNFARMFNVDDPIVSQSGEATMNSDGIDLRETMDFVTESGVHASLFSDVTVASDRRGMIYGEKGAIEVDNINDPEWITVYEGGRTLKEKYRVQMPLVSTGFQYEVEEAGRMIEEGRTESESMPLDETLRMMEIMDSWRTLWHLKLGSEVDS